MKYIMSETNNVKLFNTIIDIIEKIFPDADMYGAIDVDGSALQSFYTDKGKITVIDDFELEELYIKSDFNLDIDYIKLQIADLISK